MKSPQGREVVDRQYEIKETPFAKQTMSVQCTGIPSLTGKDLLH